MSQTPLRADGLVLSERSVAIAHVACRGGAAVREQLARSLGVVLPEGPQLAQAGSLSLLGIAPGRWLALREPADYDFAADLAALLRLTASVCDQTDAYEVLRLRGPAVRPTLAKLIPVDVHEQAFAVGRLAVTIAAHIGITVWRLPDESGPVFDVAFPRSYAATFRAALHAAAMEFGLAVAG